MQKDPELKDNDLKAKVLNILLLFCQMAQADNRVREAFVGARLTLVRKSCDIHCVGF
jgi:hypothetical protein